MSIGQSDQHQKYAELFEFSNECTGLALGVAALLPEAKTNGQIAIGLFFARCVTHYQAAMLLAENGMTIESLSLSRGLLETVFVMLAIAENAVEPCELARHDAASRVKHANALLNAKDYPNVQPFVGPLSAFVGQHVGATAIDMREFARRGNALAAYDSLYRHLSHHASHPSLSAVNDYLVDGADGRLYVQLRPLLDKTPASILSACAGILQACYACEKTDLTTEQISSLMPVTWSRYESLDEQYSPWACSPARQGV
ncbi:hypothetical protein ALP03_200147 [Pseudomonas amygdali pv. tabaci]|uniref:Uncharacterized protein n=1 Tax=Pseudomonas amygdali pv. tabaci TaxID=322 RepID=A0A3M6HS51_PSEAJ|nr:hypothetical protein ALP03_200147 [Pseudomonas amygdali pv. tabaci]